MCSRRGAEPVAVVGLGQTHHVAARQDVSIAGLFREAAIRALEDAELTWADIDAVAIGKAPDFFEGVMMPELYLAAALGAVGKPMLREGWKLVEAGATGMDGDLPVNPSGGVLSSNPIGASGMIRFAEAALQVRGRAGEHRIDGAPLALGHAYGGGAQFFAMWLVGSEPSNLSEYSKANPCGWIASKLSTRAATGSYSGKTMTGGSRRGKRRILW
jgi:acetyl-CoA acetyltransferase